MADESIKAPEVKYPDIKEFAKNNVKIVSQHVVEYS